MSEAVPPVRESTAGRIGYGIDTCWYEPGAPETASSETTYRVGNFEEIPSLVART